MVLKQLHLGLQQKQIISDFDLALPSKPTVIENQESLGSGQGQILDVLRPVNREGSYQGETKCIPTTSKISDSLFNTDTFHR